MTESSFNKLVDLLAPHLQVDEAKSRNFTVGIMFLSARTVVARFMDAVIATTSTVVSGVLSVR
jgi:hypothetical protein